MQRLAIIVPYRDRESHLLEFVPCLKKLLPDSNIYVIEQFDQKPFNRGKLGNASFLEFKKEFEYFAFSDVDMLPEMADYSYCDNPCHIATEVEQFGYRMPFKKYFGGVTLLPNHKFEEVNGFSNEYWFWGGEDCELRRRFEKKQIQIESRQCRFKSLPHDSNVNHEMRMKNFARLQAPVDWSDGLSSCKYEIVDCDDLDDYTILKVKL